MRRLSKAVPILLILILSVLTIVLYRNNAQKKTPDTYQSNHEQKQYMADEMKITTTAFEEGERMPIRFTCAGENINPTLQISGVPEDAKSLVLLMEDPDVNPKLAKDDVWYHWVIFNLKPTRKLIREGEEPSATAGEGSSSNLEYYGPCPPPPEGEHRYFFRLFALDEKLGLEEGATGPQVKTAMEDHIIAEAEYMGTYSRGDAADEE